MVSAYKQYITERTNKEMIESDKGFIVYSITPNAIYVEDVWVAPAHRRNGVASKFGKMIEEIALERGLHIMLSSVDPRAKNATESLKFILEYGCKLDSCTENFILLKKEI